MNRFFGMLRYSRQLLVVSILFLIEVCFVLAVGVFDVIQLVITRTNASKLSSAFIPLNITAIVVVAITLFAVSIMFVIKCIKGRNNEF